MKQNNSLDIYGHYFENDDDKTGCAVSCMTITSVLKDSSPGVSGRGRCVSDLSWSNGQASRLVVSYCSRLFRDDREDSASSGHVYDCDDPRRPVVVLAPPSDLTSSGVVGSPSLVVERHLRPVIQIPLLLLLLPLLLSFFSV